jgi:hypothetical protein
MKTVWKWILGVLAVVLILAVLTGAGFMWRRYALGANPAITSQRGWYAGPMMRGDDYGRNVGPMMGRDGYHSNFMPMMGGRGFFPFGGFFFLGGLVKLLFFGLLLYGAYWLGKRNARVSVDRRPSPPPETPAAPDDVPPAS